MQLSSILIGAVATTAIAEYLATAYKVGEAAYADFKKTRLESKSPTVRFNDKLKKQKLKTFSALSKTKTVAKGKGQRHRNCSACRSKFVFADDHNC